MCSIVTDYIHYYIVDIVSALPSLKIPKSYNIIGYILYLVFNFCK